MARATWRGRVLADSDTFELYFPRERVDMAHLRPSQTHTRCPWKGVASYHDVVVVGEVLRAAAWNCPETSPEAAHLRGHIAIWRGVEVTR